MRPCSLPAITRVTKLFGKVPKAVTADRGYGEASVETELESMGVKHVAIPRRGRPGPQRQQSRVLAALSQAGQVAHRFGRSDRPPEAILGMGTDRARRHRRCAHLVRVGSTRPQRHQDLRSHRRTRNKERFNANRPTKSHRTTVPPSTTTEELCRLIRPRPLPSRPRSGNDRKTGAKMTGAIGIEPHAGTQMSVMPGGVRACTEFFRSK